MYGGVGDLVGKMMIKDKKGDVQDLIDFVAQNHSYQDLKQEETQKQRWKHARRILLPRGVNKREKKVKKGKRVKKNSVYENKKTRNCIIDPQATWARITKHKQGTSKYLKSKSEEKGVNVVQKEECLLHKKVKRIRKAVPSGVYGYRTDSIDLIDISSLPSNIIEVRVPPPKMIPRMSLKKRKLRQSRVHRNRRNKMIIEGELATRTETLKRRTDKSN